MSYFRVTDNLIEVYTSFIKVLNRLIKAVDKADNRI